MIPTAAIRNAFSAIANQNVEETGKIITESLAFKAVINKDPKEIIKHTIAASVCYDNIHDKLRYYMFALDTAKADPVLFIETSCIVATAINEMPEYKAHIAYEILASAGQKDFEKIINAAGIASKTGKKTGATPRKVVKAEPTDYNKWIVVKSRSLATYMYSPQSKTLHVQFTSGPRIYSYYEVEPSTFRGLQNAASKGEFFGQYIKVQHSANFK